MMLWPWREVQILRERLTYYETRCTQLQAEEVQARASYLQMYRDMIASQKGCRRLRRALDRERSRRKQREDHA